MFQFLKIEVYLLEFSNDLRCWHGLHQSFSTQCDVQLYSWHVFYLKSFRISNWCLKFLNFEIQNLKFPNDLECCHDQYQICSGRAIYNFVIDKFFYLKPVRVSNAHFKFPFWDSNFWYFSNNLGYRHDIYQSCSAWQDLNFVVKTFSGQHIQYKITKC